MEEFEAVIDKGGNECSFILPTESSKRFYLDLSHGSPGVSYIVICGFIEIQTKLLPHAFQKLYFGSLDQAFSNWEARGDFR
uniref:Uncharacterized protein n=1 Tax=Timema poppense TaxID=170557 RepID=A0A7R9DE90_TIMPO|nr:unnamed protein product [Timema poppensis]